MHPIKVRRTSAIAGKPSRAKANFSQSPAQHIPLGQSDYIGAITIDTEHAGRHNRVVGATCPSNSRRPQDFLATFLTSQTGITPPQIAIPQPTITYSYNTRRYTWSNQVEHYGREFSNGYGLLQSHRLHLRVVFGEVNFYPKEGGWLKRVHPFYWTKRGRDQVRTAMKNSLMPVCGSTFNRQAF